MSEGEFVMAIHSIQRLEEGAGRKDNRKDV